MVNSQLIELLQHFTPEALHELQLFVASPYFNRGLFSREAASLLDFILDTAPEYPVERLERGAAYAAVFPGTPVVEGKLDKVMSELHKLTKAFISVQRYRQADNEFQRLLDLAAFYRDHDLDNRYRTLTQKLIKFQHEARYRDQDFFQREFLLDYEIHSYQSQHNDKRDDTHIQKTLLSLDLQYFFLKTELLNRYLIQQKVARLDVPEEMVQTIKESHLPERYAGTYPVLLLSHKIFQLLEKERTDIAEFEELHGLLGLHEAEIEPGLLKFYFTYLRNLCVLLFNNGQTELLPVLFKLQKEHFGRGYLYYDGKIAHSTFLNITNTALRLKEYEWAKTFIFSHEHRVVGDNETRDYFRLVLANYLFHTKEYDQALDALPPAFQALDYHIFSRRLELKIYHELDSDLLPYKIDAFKMYLSRASKNLISSLTREQNTNFINLLFQISTTTKGDKARIGRLIDRINTKQSVTEREWLLEKAAQLA